MKTAVVKVRNVENLSIHFANLETRDPKVPGIMVCDGETGAGKTTAVQWLAGAQRGVWLRATALWTPRAMLTKFVTELEGAPFGGASDMLDWTAAKLVETQRPVFIDEADYLVSDKRLIESLRDLHDLTNVPFVLIGMAEFRKALAKRPQLSGRVSQRIEFAPIDLADATLVVNQLAEVSIAPDLIARAHERTRGSMRRLIVAISHIEQHAKQARLTEINLSRWGNRSLSTDE